MFERRRRRNGGFCVGGRGQIAHHTGGCEEGVRWIRGIDRNLTEGVSMNGISVYICVCLVRMMSTKSENTAYIGHFHFVASTHLPCRLTW